MIIHSILLDGLELTNGNYYFHLSGFEDFEKDVVTNDMCTDGEAWGRSKNKPKTLVLDGYILSDSAAAEWALNRVLGRNGLKTLVINNKYKCQVEVTNRGSDADNSHIVTAQLTMPDPYLYALNPQSVQLGATYSTGVIFGPGHGVMFAGLKTISGNPLDLSDALKIRSLNIGGNTTQDGVGTPSFENIRAIHGTKYAEKWEGTLAGGRNLYLNSSSIHAADSDTRISVNETSDEDYATVMHCIQADSSVAYWVRLSALLSKCPIVNAPFTVSLMVKGTARTNCQPILNFYYNDASGYQPLSPNVSSEKYTQISHTFNLPNTTPIMHIGMENFKELYVALIKVEVGTVSTAYSPAPEDLLSYQQIMLPQEIFDEDYFDVISEQGQAKKRKYTVTGLESITEVTASGAPHHAYQFTMTDNGPDAFVDGISSHFVNVGMKYGTSIGFGLQRINNTLYFQFGSDLSLADFISLLKSQNSNQTPVTILYKLGTPQQITGTPISIPSKSIISADNGATVTAVYEPEHGAMGQDIIFGVATGESGTMANDGNVDAYPVITVVGTCSGISVRNLTTGEHIDISVALGDSDTLVIDCRPATCGVYLNGIPHIEFKTCPGWIHCPPGDNQFSFSRSSMQNKKHCTVELQSRWI